MNFELIEEAQEFDDLCELAALVEREDPEGAALIKSYGERALYWERQGLCDYAADECEKMLTCSTMPEAYSFVASELIVYGEGRRAVEICRGWVAENGEDPVRRRLLGAVCMESGRYAEAATSYERVITLGPGTADDHVRLGNCYAKLERYGQAADQYLRALDLMPHSWSALFQLGCAYHEMGRHEEGIAALTASLEAGWAGGPGLHEAMGDALRALGRYGDAAEAYGRALEDHTGCRSCAVKMARALERAGHSERAEWMVEEPAPSGPLDKDEWRILLARRCRARG